MSAGDAGEGAVAPKPIKVGAKKARDFREQYGPAALVTGAAQGIGRAFADSVAARGLSVVMLEGLVWHSRDHLRTVQQERRPMLQRCRLPEHHGQPWT